LIIEGDDFGFGETRVVDFHFQLLLYVTALVAHSTAYIILVNKINKVSSTQYY